MPSCCYWPCPPPCGWVYAQRCASARWILNYSRCDTAWQIRLKPKTEWKVVFEAPRKAEFFFIPLGEYNRLKHTLHPKDWRRVTKSDGRSLYEDLIADYAVCVRYDDGVSLFTQITVDRDMTLFVDMAGPSRVIRQRPLR
jgi:hypothetical protein